MTIRLKILMALLLIQFSLNGQFPLANKAFRKHIQTCHVVGTTEEDFNIVLYKDSTIKIITYKTNYIDQYNAVTRFEYTGTYCIIKDTLKVRFIGYTTEIKRKNKNIDPIFRSSDLFFQYPPITYLIDKNEIIALNDLNPFPTLISTKANDIVLLETKFSNWDKTSTYTTEVFGLQ